MPSAKPVYDPNEVWKHRQFDSAQWEELVVRLQIQLRPLYPDKNAVECETFGHPADGWVSFLLSEAWDAISLTLGSCLRLTKEQLSVERQDILTTMEKAVRVLSRVSPDLDRLFGIDADVLGTRDKIRALIPYIASSDIQIDSLPKAIQKKEVLHAAAVEMATRVLRSYKDQGGRISATADPDLDYVSDAVKLLQVLGNELGLTLDIGKRAANPS